MVDRQSAKVQLMQLESRTKQFAKEVQSFSQRLPKMGVGPPAMQRWQDSFRRYGEAMLTMAQAMQAK
jgi:hypothetical protein